MSKRSEHSSPWHPFSRVSETAPGVFFVEGPASNWIIVRDETGYILIDSGYPEDSALVRKSIEHVGLKPSAAKAMLITHGHVDHTGSAALFSRTFGTPVLCSPEELPHVQGHEKHQVTLGQVLIRAWRPKVLRWMKHAIAAGSLSATPATAAQAWTAEQLAGLPGSPEAILVPGHTPGNVAILFRAAGVIVTGDSFITGHPLSRHTGPQMLHPMYHSEPATALSATHALDSVEASVILPGHGPALAMPLGDALASLRR
ncbi:MBL fold metallo-hydrolase [Arthrobacter methylotrophus]|uniref:MBL fold metallo-hydrolase n=1 Tax=Arthrobacter methylotrophus TaxID=121291 RepID=A0ABV5UNK8_9MICC